MTEMRNKDEVLAEEEFLSFKQTWREICKILRNDQEYEPPEEQFERMKPSCMQSFRDRIKQARELEKIVGVEEEKVSER
jgi:hypothetical protein